MRDFPSLSRALIFVTFILKIDRIKYNFMNIPIAWFPGHLPVILIPHPQFGFTSSPTAYTEKLLGRINLLNGI
jgi:hypothetical protein